MRRTVEERIKSYALDLDAAAEQRATTNEAARLDQPVSVAVVESSPATRGRGKWIAATVGLILVVGAAEAPMFRSNGNKRPSVAPAAASDWLIPNEIDGYHLWESSAQTGISYPERYRMQLARPTPGGGYTDPVTVTIGDNLSLLVRSDRGPNATRTTVDVNGVSAEIVEGSNAGRTVLQYELDDGDAVVFTDNNDPVSSDTRQLLQSLAEVIKPADVGGFTVRGDLPAGYKVLVLMNMKRDFGPAPDLTFIDNKNRQSVLFIETVTSPPQGYELFSITGEVEPVDVRGVTGWFTSDDGTNGGVIHTGGSTTLFWREPSGQQVSINSSAATPDTAPLSKSQLVAVANGLRPVSEAEWQTFAQTADTVGDGVGAAAGPTQVAFPTPPAGYRVDFAHLDDSAELYGQARYVSVDDPGHQPVIEVLLRGWTPDVWQSHLEGDLRDNPRGTANGRRVVFTSPGLSTTSPHPEGRAVAMEWTANVVVEVVVSAPDHSPLDDKYGNQALAELAHTLNGVTFFTPGPINEISCTVNLGGQQVTESLGSDVGISTVAPIGSYKVIISILGGPKLEVVVTDSKGATLVTTTAGGVAGGGEVATPDGPLEFSCAS